MPGKQSLDTSTAQRKAVDTLPTEPVPRPPAPEPDPPVLTLTRAELHAREARAYAAGWRDALAATRPAPQRQPG
jgi:hypothetical protein